MGDTSRKDRSVKSTRNSIGCILLRRSRRRANSEPPKAKRTEREKVFSHRTSKPRKIARDEGYPEARNSESDSGFLSFESIGSKRSNASNISMNQDSRNNRNLLRKESELKPEFDVGNDSSPPLLVGPDDDRVFDQPDIVDLNDNFGEFVNDNYEQEARYDSDGVSLQSSNICNQCGCLPRIFKSSRNSQNSYTKPDRKKQNVEDSLFDLRGSDLLRTISDLRSSVAEQGSSSSEENQCFLNLVYNEHRCVDPGICNKAKFARLNAHLRTLVDCMPQSFCDCESKSTWQNYILDQTGYIPQRRNAVCETAEKNRDTICKAFGSYMTLKALLRYDLL